MLVGPLTKSQNVFLYIWSSWQFTHLLFNCSFFGKFCFRQRSQTFMDQTRYICLCRDILKYSLAWFSQWILHYKSHDQNRGEFSVSSTFHQEKHLVPVTRQRGGPEPHPYPPLWFTTVGETGKESGWTIHGTGNKYPCWGKLLGVFLPPPLFFFCCARKRKEESGYSSGWKREKWVRHAVLSPGKIKGPNGATGLQLMSHKLTLGFYVTRSWWL